METARRELTFLLAGPERRLLCWIAARLPAGVTPDHLTALGVAGALLTGVAYALSANDSRWLLVACAGLAVNWLGDSLDGTLARVRRIERPRYGYYLDHAVDAITTALIGVGLGLSPYVGLAPALALVTAYLALSINIYLESHVLGVFRLSYGKLGPTEVRLLLVIASAVLALGDRRWWTARQIEPAADTIALLIVGGMGGLFLWRMAQNLASLSRLEPPRRRRAAVRSHRGGAFELIPPRGIEPLFPP